MDIRLAPAEHYDKASELIEQGGAPTDSGLAFLSAIAHSLQGILRVQMGA